MYPRLTKSGWESLKKEKPTMSAFTSIGSLKVYKSTDKTKISVVVSSKQEKTAVKRNLLKRRGYVVLNKLVLNKGVYIFFPSKKAYNSSFLDIKEAIAVLYEKTR